MRDFEPTYVRDLMGPEPAVGTPGPEDFRQNIELPRPGRRARQSFGAVWRWQKESVDNVHTLGLGLGRAPVGSGRIPYVSAGVQCSQGLECSSSPTSGTAFPLVRGVFALTC